MLSCFINFIFNSFAISYWIYFVVIERKKKNLKKKTCRNFIAFLKSTKNFEHFEKKNMSLTA